MTHQCVTDQPVTIIEKFYKEMLDEHGYSKKDIKESGLAINSYGFNGHALCVGFKEEKFKKIHLLTSLFIRENVKTIKDARKLVNKFEGNGDGYYAHIIPLAELVSGNDLDRILEGAKAVIRNQIKEIDE